jgi:hypothetical protein
MNKAFMTAERPKPRSAALDEAHVGHIHGTFGTILQGNHGSRVGVLARLKTLLRVGRRLITN